MWFQDNSILLPLRKPWALGKEVLEFLFPRRRDVMRAPNPSPQHAPCEHVCTVDLLCYSDLPASC